MSSFEVLRPDSGTAARRGLLRTTHGDVATPAFCPVGTVGAVKGVTPRELKETGADIILANTYHLLLRPGVKTVEELGGLHKFMSWEGPILTDSGGYQVFSLGSLTKIDDDGVEFSSHVDGAKVYLSAEIATRIQNQLGGDVIMCLDECVCFGCEEAQLRRAADRTICWARQCRQAHTNSQQLLFGVVQGGIDLPLRTQCVSELVKLDFDGYAIGGLSVGEGHEAMIKTVSHTATLLPEDKPRYLMGVGTPADIVAAVMAGVDIFDCVLPTRNGRNAFAFTENGPIRLRNNARANDPKPVEGGCDCYCCKNFSRGTIRHFFNVSEMLGPVLLSLHNLRFYQRLMAQIRQAIEKGEFADWAGERLGKYKALYQ
ncbi:MAG: tRNA guanosine(34) transglycosylase Tgt [Planctomycetota bacterium]|nr:MAG: tRNA guanosine(34) transglycosylase Tgt [Planctomycetota bacterium]